VSLTISNSPRTLAGRLHGGMASCFYPDGTGFFLRFQAGWLQLQASSPSHNVFLSGQQSSWRVSMIQL